MCGAETLAPDLRELSTRGRDMGPCSASLFGGLFQQRPRTRRSGLCRAGVFGGLECWSVKLCYVFISEKPVSPKSGALKSPPKGFDTTAINKSYYNVVSNCKTCFKSNLLFLSVSTGL